ncbi:MAG: c-type cytochrome [Planctomycetes bacterium]|nr:c-type cytochrome [Planctomycetota bacterium]
MVSISLIQNRSTRWLGTACVALVSVALVAGCTKPLPVSFRLDKQGRDPKLFDPKAEGNQVAAEKKISTALYALFGTPDDPWVFAESGLDIYKIRLASGPVSSNENGEQRGLYRQHCAHCHGITGDGAGPTAAFLTPYPRDYRKGVYKFKANELAQKPSNDDLHRTLREGINGTAMPSFLLLPEQERDALIEYVKYLSMRGEMEILLASQVFDDDSIELTRDFLVTEGLSPLAENWADDKTGPIQIPPKPEITDHVAWAKAGAELFKGPKAQCAKCHGPNGLGDGSEELLFDEWNKEKKQTVLPKEIATLEHDLRNFQPPPGMKPADEAAAREALRKQIDGKRELLKISHETYLLPEQQIQPRNLRQGLYRFGRNMTDTYRRVHAGIAGTPMPAGGKSLTPTEIWQLVDYVRLLPYDQRLTSAAASPTAGRAHN